MVNIVRVIRTYAYGIVNEYMFYIMFILCI